MLKRKTPKAAATRESVLKAALFLFSEKGYEAVSMKDIADAAGLSVGAAYYHFRGKDELVLAYYQSTQQESEDRCKITVEATTNFRKRVGDIIEFKFAQLEQQRSFLSVLASHAANPDSPLSPFSSESKEIREKAIKLFDDAIEGSDLKIAPSLRRYFPQLLWLYHMGLIFFWLHDKSNNQEKTMKIFNLSLELLIRFAALSKLPMVSALNKKFYQLLELVLPTVGLVLKEK